MKARVFLSYARRDGTVACDFFQKSLQNAGYLVWRDIDNLPGGAPWRQQIENTIRGVDAVLLFLTPDAIASPNVTEEWTTAIHFGKRIIPLMVSTTAVPPELRVYNYRDIREQADCALEPSRIQRDLADERSTLRNEFERVRSQIDGMIPNPNQRKQLDPFVEQLRLALATDLAVYPPEVLRMLNSLLSSLAGELAAGRDITFMVESMAMGTFASNGWSEETVYRNRADVVKPILAKVSDALPSISLPVIVVAMTQGEAAELENGSVFASLPAEWKQEFDAVRSNLPAGWQQRYAATAEEWEPFAGQGTIASLLRADFAALGAKCQSPLRPSFIDIRSLRLDKNREQLWDLRARACLVVIDAISTRHPQLHAAFRASHLDVPKTTLVVRLLPHQTLGQVRNTLNFLLREWLECEYMRRADVDREDTCETFSELPGFQKWIRNQVKRALPECAAPKSEMRSFINKLV